MLIVQIKPSAAKTLTLLSLQRRTCCEQGNRLVGILSPGLVPSMDYSISLRALDHTELYLDSQSESSNLQQGVHGCTPCHTQVPTSPSHGTGSVGAGRCPSLEGMAAESSGEPLCCPPRPLPKAPLPPPLPQPPLDIPSPLIRFSVCLLLERSLMPKHLPSPAPCSPCALLTPSCWLCVAIFAQPTEQKYRELC